MTGPEKTRRFEQTTLPHLDAAYNLARWLAGTDHDAADVVQEAYLRAFKYFDSFTGGSARAWLLSIVRHAAYDWRSRNRELPVGDAVAESDRAVHGNESSGAGNDPLSLLMREQERNQVNRAIAALPVDSREVIVLREIEGLSYREIANALGVPMGTVMSRLARARDMLRKALLGQGRGA